MTSVQHRGRCLTTPELVHYQKLQLLRAEQVEVSAQGITLLDGATVGQGQVPQPMHMLEEKSLHLLESSNSV